MIEAPSLEKVKRHIRETGNPICCILFAPSFDEIGLKQIIPRLAYLDNRTSEKIHFYCVGYMGYGHISTFPDMKELGVFKYSNGTEIPWSFSQMKFAEFVNEMEDLTSWRYSGGTELIVLDSKADFSNAIIFKIDDMIKDKAITNVNQLIETLIQQSRKEEKTIEDFSLNGLGEKSSQALVDSIIELLPNGLKSLSAIWTKGKHYTLDDITKK